MNNIAIIGSGPTGIYTLLGLIESRQPLEITIFEAEAVAGKGMPYHPALNDKTMLSNIASIELPAVCETLVGWLHRQPDEELQRMNIPRDMIGDREFYPRVVLGEYFQSQLDQLRVRAADAGHEVVLKAGHTVTDITLEKDDVRLTVRGGADARQQYAFRHVVMATGHTWPDNTETKPGYFISPWPTDALGSIGNSSVAILGTSLSGIDAVVGLATKNGSFYLDAHGQLEYQPAAGMEDFRLSMMSRKGLLPEADFYCPIPYEPLTICNDEAIDGLIESGRSDLLDAVFDLFKQELALCDPEYAASIGLSLLTLENLSAAYFRARQNRDVFVWAATNLAEAKNNRQTCHTVAWRYAILRMHEVVARIVPVLNSDDLKRFHKYFKTIFVDDYATVPHESIERLLALRRAGKLNIIALGDDYEIQTPEGETGAVVQFGDERIRFGAFIDATGQHTLDADDIPFPSLLRQGVVRKASTAEAVSLLNPNAPKTEVRAGGIDLDDCFRLRFEKPLTNRLYCVSLSFLLHKFPFVQGITSASELGAIVSAAILEDSGRDHDIATAAAPALMLESVV